MRNHFRTVPVTIILSICCFASAATLPLAVGNQWIYAHHDSVILPWALDEDQPMPGGHTCSLTVGTQVMKVQSISNRQDSSFISISFSDSGTWMVHLFSSTGWDSSASSSYHSVSTTTYLVLRDTIYMSDGFGNWPPETDYRFSYMTEPDTSFSVSSANYSCKTIPAVLHVGGDSAAGYEKSISKNSNDPLMGSYTWQDTVRWAGKFGMTSSRIHHSNAPGQFAGRVPTFTFSAYTLLSFSKLTNVVQGRHSGSSTRSLVTHSPASKMILTTPVMKSVPGARLFSLTGRQLSNRTGRQILILAP